MEHGARELNPIVGALLNTLGPVGFVAVKAGVALYLVHVHSVVPTGLLATANVVTCGAAANNVKVIRELKTKPRPAPKKPAQPQDSEEVGRGGEI